MVCPSNVGVVWFSVKQSRCFCQVSGRSGISRSLAIMNELMIRLLLQNDQFPRSVQISAMIPSFKCITLTM